MTKARPLDGIRVVSLATRYPGPYAGMILADLGAQVIVVENPHAPDDARTLPGFYDALNRGKASVALDLKDRLGYQAFLALARTADVILEGSRPGSATRLGVDFATVRGHAPRIVYVSISAYGQDGPFAGLPAHDVNIQAQSGLLAEDAHAEPYSAGPQVEWADLCAGMSAVQAVLLGLLMRDRTGEACYFDVSMFDCLVSALAGHLAPVANQSGPPGVPYEGGYGVFRAADGLFITLGIAGEDHFWQQLCDALGLPEERTLDAQTRLTEAPRLRRKVASVLATRSQEEWLDNLQKANVPCSAVLDLAHLADHPQVMHRALLQQVDANGGRYVRQPLVVDGASPGPVGGPPRLGEHTIQILRSCGLAMSSVEDLIDRGVAIDAEISPSSRDRTSSQR